MKTKRILITSLLISVLFTSYASAANKLDYDRDAQVLTVTADGGYFNSGTQISLMMYRSDAPEGGLSRLDKEEFKALAPYFYEKKADISGTAVFSIPLPDSIKGIEEYTIKLASSTYAAIDEISCQVYSTEELDKAKDGLIKAIDNGTVNSYLENSTMRKMLGIDDMYDRVPDKTIVSDSLKKQKAVNGINSFADIKDTESNIEWGIRLSKEMNLLDSWLNVRSFVDNFYAYKGFESAEYVKYKALSDTAAIDKQIFGKKPYSGLDSFERVFRETVNDPPEEKKTVYPTGGGGGGGGGGSVKITASGNLGSEAVSLTPTAPAPIQQPQDRVITFHDVADGFWAKDAIDLLVSRGVVSGVGDNTFAPYDVVTREQFLKMLLLSEGIECDAFDCSFADVDKNEWYYNYVATAELRGLANGYEDGRFGVGESITREDICVLAYRSLSEKVDTIDSDLSDADFADAEDIADYAKEAVAFFQSSGIISGYPDGTFLPKNTASRAEACKIIVGITDMMAER